MIEIAQGVFWDTQKNLNEQSPLAQNMVQLAAKSDPVSISYEDCPNGFQRVINCQRSLNNCILTITFIYTNDAQSREWAGLNNVLYTINNGE